MNAIEKIRAGLIDTGGIDKAALIAFISVESGGKGFGADGRLLIQFEPHWFKKKAPYAPTGAWSVNGIEKQSAEWIAFESAAETNIAAAIESTSIGLPQIMGFHYARLGYHAAIEMWSDFSESEDNQILALVKFIKTDASLLSAIMQKDWHKIASIYNGAGYHELAAKIGREPYNISMQKAYEKEVARG